MSTTVKAIHVVKPARETPNGVMYVPDIDQYYLITHESLIYFYRRSDPSGCLFTKSVETLKSSLSQALAIFYPLAGRLQWTSRKRLELVCNSEGAVLITAESTLKVDDFGDFRPSEALKPLIPSVDNKNLPVEQQTLLLVQVTKFSCGGIAIGLDMSHVLVDGSSHDYFMQEWARIARGDEPAQNIMPFLDRTVLQPPKQQQQQLFKPRYDYWDFSSAIGQSDSMEQRKKETTVSMFTLSKFQVQKLKNKANQGNTGPLFTRNEAVSAHLWISICKARQLDKQQETKLRLIVNARNRITPNLPKSYFGNAILLVAATSTVGDLVTNPLSYACGKIREAFEKVTDEYVRSALAYFDSEPDLSKLRHAFNSETSDGPLCSNPNIQITSVISSLFGTDFGWGKEVYMGADSIVGDGKSYISPGYGDDGSFVISLRLQVAHMDSFKNFFYQTPLSASL